MSITATNSRWKIIACDLDGTLIGWDRTVHDRDVAALRHAHAAGFHVAICTGRNSRECTGIIETLSLEDLGVFVNGAMVCRMAGGAAVHSAYFEPAFQREAVEFFGSRGHSVLALVDDPVSRLPAYCRTDHAPPHPATVDWLISNRVSEQFVGKIPAEYHERIVRLGVVANVPQAGALFADLRRHFGERCAAHSIYSPRYDCQVVEMFHPGVNKWTGLLHLADATDASPDQIIAIGDDINDLPMLENARLSFAMAGSARAVCEKAKRLTASHAECGVAEVVEALLAGKWE